MFTIPHYRLLLPAFVIFLLVACSANVRATPEISWDDKLATPGAQITFEKESESSYTMRVSGLPKDKDYVLWMKWVDDKIQRLPVPDTKGLFEGKAKFNFSKMYRGEPILFALVSSDQAVRVYAQLIPFPLDATDEGGCKLSLAILSANQRLLGIIGEGFQPGEQVTTISKSESEILRDEKIALENGRIAVIIDPGVIGKTGGLPTFQAVSKTCDVTLRYAWGTAMKRIDE